MRFLKRIPHGVRLCFVAMLLPAMPGLPFLLTLVWQIPEKFAWLALLWMPIAVILWAFVWYWVSLKSRYICRECDGEDARIVFLRRGEDGTESFIKCDACGARRPSGVWFGGAG